MSDGSVEFPSNEDEFSRLQVDIQRQLNTAARLPEWPFLVPFGFVTVYEYDRVLGGSFGRVL